MSSAPAPTRPASLTLLAAALTAPLLVVTAAPEASASSGVGMVAAQLARVNGGKGAGTCSQVNPAPNSLGGTAFDDSCTGNSGAPEYWCADFAKWVWRNAGADTTGLTAWAHSFVEAAPQDGATVHTDPAYRPQPGDAVVYSTHHVGIVSAVGEDGSIEITNGDWGGEDLVGVPEAVEEAHFGATSLVVLHQVPAAQVPVGVYQQAQHYTATAYVTPRPARHVALEMLNRP
ncbi:CHAP domain-containing protein [Kitasatospora viridis]|uniref:CHAP domain-containing protein n=1 Tax=Kitasatospora viridis TaxID=281105 RepID=A0A561T7G0_9ACTN|nr:CHAP domain-containing protein [Kitasatospora viridis]TWF83040.1 CHAP domain-containing protein [Kitasatospora viridis]